ncbi:MAG: AbrB/MazE/SpoVT family DNA-binding domain-containing protein [Methylophilus sp.]|uniref:AbrB/MazE/SpoVT family DNA-binding domain-containing protein n=1 Tax=Methylophilus sp. TaxID=29541 RepID=UPI004036FACE
MNNILFIYLPMSMRTTLKQIDDGFELEIPHEFFELLKLRIGDEVDIRVKDNSIILKPVPQELRKE